MRQSYKKRPFNCGPLAAPVMRELFEAFNASPLRAEDVQATAGVCKHSLFTWAKGNNATVANVEAVLNAMGFTMTIRPLEKGDGS